MSSTSKSKPEKSPKTALKKKEVSNPLPKGGAALLLQKDETKVEHFPMLDVVFDKFVQHLSLDLRNFFQTNTESKLKDVNSLTFSEYLQTLSPNKVFNIVKTANWDSSNLIVVDKSLIYALINVLMGGKRQAKGPAQLKDDRSFSGLEFNLVERFVNLTLNELARAFSVVYPLSFTLDRQETNSKLIGTVSNQSPVIVCSVKIDVAEFSGQLDVVIPHISLDPIREELLKKHVGDSFGAQGAWRSYLTNELLQTEFELSAVLLEETQLLSEVLNWKKGSSLKLETHQLDEIELRCESIQLAKGKLGHHNGMISIEVDEVNLNTVTDEVKLE